MFDLHSKEDIFFLTVKFQKRTTDALSLYPYLYLHMYTLIQYNMFTLEILWGISFFVGDVINTSRTEQFQFLLTYDAFTIQVAHWSTKQTCLNST